MRQADGYLDLAFSGTGSAMKLYRNQGFSGFSISSSVAIQSSATGLNVFPAFHDYDGDG